MVRVAAAALMLATSALYATAFQATTFKETRRRARLGASNNNLSAAEALLVSQVKVAEKVKDCLRAVEALVASSSAVPDVSGLEGAWRVLWSDVGASRVEKALGKLFQPSLRMLSFGVLPDVAAPLVDSFNVVRGDEYNLVQVFDTFALRLSGPLSSSDSGRVNVTFTHVSLLPLSQAAPLGEVDPAIQALLDTTIPLPKPRPTHIDLTYLSPTFRIHKGASGKTYVLERTDPASLPFTSSSSS